MTAAGTDSGAGSHSRTGSDGVHGNGGGRDDSRSAGRVSGRVALVTGAARGQGRSHAVRLATEGADVIGIDLCQDVTGIDYPMATPDDLTETALMVAKAGGRMVTDVVDVRDIDGDAPGRRRRRRTRSAASTWWWPTPESARCSAGTRSTPRCGTRSSAST